MYPQILACHSFVRWLVLISLIYAIVRAYKGYKSNMYFTPLDNSIRHWTATIAHIQLVLGLLLYVISPIIQYFLENYKETVHQKEFRFFGMEHISMMLLGVIVITIGSIKSKRKETDKEKFRVMALWYFIGLLIILSSIPWPNSPFSPNRPLFRFLVIDYWL